MSKTEIYLDNSATTQVTPNIIYTMSPYLTNKWHNPSSLYSPSQEVKKDIENVRKRVADEINASPDEIFFTSGGCESNSMALKGLLDSKSINVKNMITTKLEHTSIRNLVSDYEDEINLSYIENNRKGELNLEHLTDLISDTLGERTLCSIQFANNEIGTIQDIKTISEIIHINEKAILHTDAVQVFGHIPIDVQKLDVDMLSASGHKIGTPKGIGFLYIKKEVQKYLRPLIYGSQEHGLRGGTENVPYIIALGEAIRCINYNNSSLINTRQYFENKLVKLGFIINGSDNKLPNNINATFAPPFLNNETLIYTLDMFGIYISSGSACNSNHIKHSLILKNIGFDNTEISKTIRITLSPDITIEDVDYVVQKIKEYIDIVKLDC